MKISLDPMPALRASAEERVNAHFNRMAAESTQQDQEHQIKRYVAKAVMERGPDAAPAAFEAEATLMGMNVTALASIILGKPDTVLERGLQRRQVVLAVRRAVSPAEIEEILTRLGLPKTAMA